MNPFEMVVLIIAIITVGRVLTARNRHGGRRTPEEWREWLGGGFGQENAQLRDEVRQLRDRVQVLERVITDNRSSLDLDREIERLRDR